MVSLSGVSVTSSLTYVPKYSCARLTDMILILVANQNLVRARGHQVHKTCRAPTEGRSCSPSYKTSIRR